MKKTTSKIILQLGTNIGDRKSNIRRCLLELQTIISHSKESSIYETKAWGVKEQNDFLNLILIAETKLNPYQLLRACQALEKKLGKVKVSHWGPRIIDIDIIFYSNKIIFSPELKIPHPFMHMRRFVLQPLVEIAPEWNHPLLQQTSAQLLDNCEDHSEVKLIVD